MLVRWLGIAKKGEILGNKRVKDCLKTGWGGSKGRELSNLGQGGWWHERNTKSNMARPEAFDA